jgi:hypothetical protein
VQHPEIRYTGVVHAVARTTGGKRLQVFVSRPGRSNDMLLFPVEAKVAAGDVLNVLVSPAPERDGQGRLTGGLVYWIDPPHGDEAA